MRALYEQFRDYGMQFVDILFDTDREAWVQTYWGKYQMHWTQMSELKEFRKSIVIDKLYKIDWILSMHLVDPEGKVVMEMVGVGKLKAKLESFPLTPQVSKTEVLPTFEDGREAINNYFAQSQRRSIQSFRSRVQAEIAVVFNVEMDGTATGARVADTKNVKGISKHFIEMDIEKQKWVLNNCAEYHKGQTVRLANNIPKWNSATQNGHPVKNKTIMNIVFQ